MGSSSDKKFATLALDTSTAMLAVAITRGGEIVGRSQSLAERNHSVYVSSRMKELMEECAVPAADIGIVAVGQGPGSYTGVRIAVTAAKTLAWIWGKPLVGVSSLEAMAYGFWRERLATASAARADAGKVWIVPLMDARRGQAYCACFSAAADGEWRREEADGIRLFENWFESLEERLAADPGQTPREIWFLSETGELTAKLLGGEGRIAVASQGASASAVRSVCREAAWLLDAAAVGLLAERRFLRGEADDVHGFAPNYTQLTEAEAKLNAARTESAR
ncbi:tRNA (adenosine(37)-N6)-threonylcarbamoyltransferase complex dimerization subunit type 1 TsaB [Cohnella fermenti]|uniref:tRNA (Adenosine(37)-N6)-threonylcarbamoyltransferase complex dimerization subunit type 1 TsaB n=2 Tax=Cohnella fermenti TaxID=2565925 RepID=A0A4S4BJE5_9BACL|nr:tRNA (adenosine(37)-N6)-threonylcarbamoyltransferase complex dimerization subunit type 1 TsaB [Cohnella fermenti]